MLKYTHMYTYVNIYLCVLMHVYTVCIMCVYVYIHFLNPFLSFSHAKYLDANQKNYLLLALGTTAD